MKNAFRILTVLISIVLVLSLTSCSVLAVVSTDIGGRAEKLRKAADGKETQTDPENSEQLHGLDPNCKHEFGAWTDYNETRHVHTCKKCGGSELGEHAYGPEEITASCTEAGRSRSVCLLCGHEVIEEVDPLGHDWGPYTVDKPATETETGLRTHTCLRCGATETEPIPVKAVLVPLDAAEYFGWNYMRTQKVSLQNLYKDLVTGCENLTEKIDLPAGITADELSITFSAYLYDHPDHFWVGDSYSVSSVSGTGELVSVSPTYLFSPADLPTAKALFEAAVEEKLKDLDGLMTQYELELALHDRIVAEATYDSTHMAPLTHSAYGNLVLGTSVCDGYAKAFQLLLYRCGINATQINGESREEAHAWTAVQIDGEWYFVDVTWDDPTGSSLPGITHAYFNVTASVLSADHTFVNDLPVPECAVTDMNYYMINGFEIPELNVTNLVGVAGKAKTAGFTDVFEFAVTGGIAKASVDDFFMTNINAVCHGLNDYLGKTASGVQWTVTADRVVRVYPY